MSDEPEEEIILKDLDDNELVAQMQDDLYDGMIPEVTEGTQILLDRGWDANCLLYTSPSPRDS